MIIPDTNIWIDHIRRSERHLAPLLLAKRIRLHPFVLGELSLGSDRVAASLLLIGEVRVSPLATPAEMLDFIEKEQLGGTGIGYVDAHLLAAARLLSGGRLWTRDKRLREQAERLGVAYAP